MLNLFRSGKSYLFKCVAATRSSGSCARKPLNYSSSVLAGDLPDGSL